MPPYAGSPSMVGIMGLAVALAVAGGRTAPAQHSVLRGVVKDSTSAPIEGADVGVVAIHRLTRTDAKGRFSIDSVRPGVVEVSVRRLGYKPQTLKVTVSADVAYSYEITLDGQPAQIDGMSVTEKRRRLGIEEFYQRRTRGLGTFFTRDDLMARHAQTPSDMLRSTPGVRFVRVPSGNGIRFNNTSNIRQCMPMLWIDAQPAPGMELDDIPVNDIEGIELYQSLSTTPGQFWRGNTTPCGTIVVWSRNPGS
jgi:hypothetical protein